MNVAPNGLHILEFANPNPLVAKFQTTISIFGPLMVMYREHCKIAEAEIIPEMEYTRQLSCKFPTAPHFFSYSKEIKGPCKFRKGV